MKNISTGTGIALLAGAIVSFPFINNLASNANASAVTAAAAAVSTAATAQTGPTIVWYGMLNQVQVAMDAYKFAMVRAWSDGRVEARRFTAYTHLCPRDWDTQTCPSWEVISDPAQGLTFDADLNFDQAVDGADLGMMLAKWGPAPRNPVPPSDCPLALINP